MKYEFMEVLLACGDFRRLNNFGAAGWHVVGMCQKNGKELYLVLMQRVVEAWEV